MKDVLEVRDRWASQGKKVAVAPGVKSRNGRLVLVRPSRASSVAV